MKAKILTPLITGAALLTAALMTGSTVFLSFAVLLFLVMLLGLIGVLLASSTLTVSAALSEETVRRGDDVMLTITVQHKGLLPIAPVTLKLSGLNDESESLIRLRDIPGKRQQLVMPYHAAHVGAFSPGVEWAAVEDLFGFWKKTVHPSSLKEPLLVMPRLMEMEDLEYAPGDPGNESMAQATEDITDPADFRSYQPGDAMKKIHWKLSLRKGELMVRRFEEPVLSEALLLMDCSQPPNWGWPDAAADTRDTLLETSASMMQHLMQQDHGARLPLMGQHPIELTRDMGEALVMEHLTRHDFSEPDQFERVLQMSTGRLRTVGAVVVIAARLNSAMVDIMIRMKRLGPTVRFYLATFNEEDERILPMVARLMHGGVEVRFVHPEKA